MDIADEILRQHVEMRRLFAVLDQVDRKDVDELASIWTRLARRLEAHAAAEEKYVYPRLLHSDDASPGEDGPQDETRDAVKDHHEIRDAVRRANAESPGTDAWWQAVRDARTSSNDHTAEEERDDLPALRRNLGINDRHRIAVQFLVYQAHHPTGVERDDRNPDTCVAHRG